MENKISAILLAGGIGHRMGGLVPKQYLKLNDKPLVIYSLDILINHPDIAEVVVVCAEDYQTLFQDYPVTFAMPGKRRQDSLFNGLQKARCGWVCVHDAARPFITQPLLTRLITEGKRAGAATLGMPVKATMKESMHEDLVYRTLNRDHVWEIQTPQFLSKKILEQGFAFIAEHNHCDVTDDVSLAELIGHPVKLVKGDEHNLKITTPEDLLFAEWLIARREQVL